MPRSKLLITLPGVLIGGAALWYIWMIGSAKFEWGGSAPDKQTVGMVQDVNQREMSQYCTGVTVTPTSTWLVGQRDDAAKNLGLAADVIDLNALVYADPVKPGQQPDDATGYSAGGEQKTTLISRLDKNGQFHTLAHVSGAACLVTTPDGASIFLLTGLDRPARETTATPVIDQTVVLRSDDQGKSWRWLDKGLFPQANQTASNLTPYFHGSDEVWAWGYPSGNDNESGEDSPGAIATGVFYSADRGVSSTQLFAKDSLLVSGEYARDKRPDIVEWSQDSGMYGEIKTHVSQLDAQRAVLWVSQSFRGRSQDPKQLTSEFFNVTTQALLQRTAGRWQVTSVQHKDGLFIDELAENDSGRVMGVIAQNNQRNDVIAELDVAKLSWQYVGKLPSPFSPLSSDSIVLREKNVFIGQNTMLINTSSQHHPARWLSAGSDASISAEAVFYSKDWGHSWQKLAIDGYLGVLGFQGAQDRVIWAKADDSRDLGVYSYGLK